MPRNGRRASSTGCYHVIIRGNNKQTLFPHQSDFEQFILILKTYLQREPVGIHHYCLMHNHVHLLINSERLDALGRYMHSVQRSYHHHYRKTYTFFGHLTQGRYRSFPIDDEGYLLECGRYIEKNPVRAKMVRAPELWAYSSYRVYAQGLNEDWITLSKAYLGLAQEASLRQSIYTQYVDVTRPYEELIHRRLQRI